MQGVCDDTTSNSSSWAPSATVTLEVSSSGQYLGSQFLELQHIE